MFSLKYNTSWGGAELLLCLCRKLRVSHRYITMYSYIISNFQPNKLILYKLLLIYSYIMLIIVNQWKIIEKPLFSLIGQVFQLILTYLYKNIKSITCYA